MVEIILTKSWVKCGEQGIKREIIKKGCAELENKIKNKKRSAVRASSMIRSLIIMNRLSYFWTLTYSMPEEDANKVNKDFNLFVKRLKYKLGDDELKYIAVKEIQEKRAEKTGFKVWHFHMALDRFIDFDLMEKVWGNGFVLVKKFEFKDEQEELENLVKQASYMAKYIKKDFDKYHEEGNKRYLCSKNLERPSKFSLLLGESELRVLEEVASVKCEFKDEKMKWLQMKNEDLKRYANILDKNGVECLQDEIKKNMEKARVE